ncbi:host specificity protein J, partial [Escherichia coli PA38]
TGRLWRHGAAHHL